MVVLLICLMFCRQSRIRIACTNSVLLLVQMFIVSAQERVIAALSNCLLFIIVINLLQTSVQLHSSSHIMGFTFFLCTHTVLHLFAYNKGSLQFCSAAPLSPYDPIKHFSTTSGAPAQQPFHLSNHKTRKKFLPHPINGQKDEN